MSGVLQWVDGNMGIIGGARFANVVNRQPPLFPTALSNEKGRLGPAMITVRARDG
jgi:hypothetical protein